MLKIKVKFMHLCILALVFFICVAFLYKDILKLKKDTMLLQKTLENVFLRVNNIESFNIAAANNYPTTGPQTATMQKVQNNEEDSATEEYEDIEEGEYEDDEYGSEDEEEYGDSEEEAEDEGNSDEEYDDYDGDDSQQTDEDGEALLKSKEYQELLKHMSELSKNDTVTSKVVNDNKVIDVTDEEPINAEEKVVELVSENENDLSDDIKINITDKKETSFDDLNSKTLAELKDILKSKQKSTKGNKKELVNRIINK